MIPEPVYAWVAEHGYGLIQTVEPVGGGCINNGARLLTTTGVSFFLKTNPSAPGDMFQREAEGLSVLRSENIDERVLRPAVPVPHLVGESFLLLEDLNPAPPAANYWTEFGRQLANLHTTTSNQFGFTHNNYIGSTPQVNTWTNDGYLFFIGHRLLFQAGLAQRSGLLDTYDYRQIEALCQKLHEFIPPQPASLIHGDLWSGNAISDSRGAPAIIDPAVYFGWAEAELAMAALFGNFPDEFYQAYEEVFPLENGYRQRFPIYNLYHLLNHLNLFGMGYLSQVRAILHRFA